MPVLGVDQKEGSRLVTYFPLVFDFVHKLIQSLGITVKMYIMIFFKYAIIFFKKLHYPNFIFSVKSYFM